MSLQQEKTKTDGTDRWHIDEWKDHKGFVRNMKRMSGEAGEEKNDKLIFSNPCSTVLCSQFVGK